MSINDPNPFEGQSLFDDRTHHTDAIGGQADQIFLSERDPEGKRIIRLVGSCDPDEKEESWKLSSCEALAWRKWQLGLVNENRVWPHRPAGKH